MNGEHYINSKADLWAQHNRTLRGKPYRFTGTTPHSQRKFLQQPLADNAKKKTNQKSRQAGVSENSVSELLFHSCTKSHKKFVYVFPTNGAMRDFVQTRIDPCIENSPRILPKIDKQKNSLRLKHISTCDVLFRSGSKASAGEGIDADGIFFDERDRMVTSILDAFKESLSSSDIGFIRDISTPSIPGTGVNLSFENSDKKYWFVKCTKCGHRQNLTFPDSIVKVKSENRHSYRCKRCKEYDCIDKTDGEWVPLIKNEEKEWSGYQITQLDCPWITADDIVKKRNDMLPQFFFNYVLGLPYAGNNILITQQHINQCIKNDISIISSTGRFILGVDWGDISWAVVGMILPNAQLLIVHYERIAFAEPEMHVKRVNDIINEWNIFMTVLDSGYGRDRNSVLYRLHPSLNKIWACLYSDTKNSKVIEPIWSKKRKTVTAHRTISLKVMARSWQQGSIVLPATVVMNNPETMVFFDHLKSLAVKLEEQEDESVWERIGHMGPDHFAHAMNYMHIAYYFITGKKYNTISLLPMGGESKTPKGLILSRETDLLEGAK